MPWPMRKPYSLNSHQLAYGAAPKRSCVWNGGAVWRLCGIDVEGQKYRRLVVGEASNHWLQPAEGPESA